MSLPVNYKKFVQGDDPANWNGCFQYTTFDSVDFRKYISPPSFYRSDFRGAIFNNTYFYMLNIDRSDIVSAVIDNCCFDMCDFGNTGICNTTISNTRFTKVAQKNAEISRSIFLNCEFEETSFDNSTAFNNKFVKCRFTRCSFRGAGFEDITFNECHFESIDLADMTPYKFIFEDCDLSNVLLSLDHLGTYLFDKTSIQKTRYKYLDDVLDIDELNAPILNGLLSNMHENGRYYELVNLCIYFSDAIGRSFDIKNILCRSLDSAINHPHPIERMEIMKNLFKAIPFHFSKGQITVCNVLAVISWCQLIDKKDLDFDLVFYIEEQARYLEKVIAFGRYPFSLLINDDLIYSEAVINFCCDLTDADEAQRQVIAVFSIIQMHAGFSKNMFVIDGVYPGSLIVRVITTAFLAMLILRVGHAAVGNVIQVALEVKACTVLMRQIEQAQTAEEINGYLTVLKIDESSLTNELVSYLSSFSRINVSIADGKKSASN